MELWCQAGGWAAPALALCRHYVNTGTCAAPGLGTGSGGEDPRSFGSHLYTTFLPVSQATFTL